MLVLVTYDVKTMTGAGRKRLRNVSKMCQNYGIRVQNSVFECKVDTAQYQSLKYELTEIINEEEDSLRFYRLSNNYQSKVEHIGAKEAINVEDSLIF